MHADYLTTKDVELLMNDYFKWLKESVGIKKMSDNEYVEITSPFLDFNNDFMQIYIAKDDKGLKITDDGYTIRNLEMEGVNWTTARINTVKKILNQYGCKLENDAITTSTSTKDFSHKKHFMMQAMMQINDMYLTISPRVKSLFLDDVKNLLMDNDIFFTSDVQFSGVSSYPHKYDLLFQRSKYHNERLCKVINQPTKQNATNILFAWEDTKSNRDKNSELIVIVNDQKKVSSSFKSALANYNAQVVEFSTLQDNFDLFAS